MTLRYDYARADRIGMPEAVLCDAKSDDQLAAVLRELVAQPAPVLLTRLREDRLGSLGDAIVDRLDYDARSSTAFLHGTRPEIPGVVAIVTAGTSDLGVAEEAGRTLRFSGVRSSIYADIGVAGVWRLEERISEIAASDVVIVVAGMDGALASVIGGLLRQPLIAVPTSIGYGVAEEGRAALYSMLASCAPGLVVTNINNGFGAACAAVRILSGARR